MIQRRLSIALLLLCIGCEKPARESARPGAAGPQVRGIVVTVRTTSEPEKRAQLSSIIVAGDRARDTRQQDHWRLYDLAGDRIIFVDDIARTTLEKSLATVVAEKRRTLAGSLPAHYPRPRFVATDERRQLAGVSARKHVIESGTYRRELWIAEHPAIPPELFAMMVASESASTPLAPMARAVDEALMQVRGFPLLDRTELTYGEKKIVIERAVTSVIQRNVAESLLTAPREYRDLTPREKK